MCDLTSGVEWREGDGRERGTLPTPPADNANPECEGGLAHLGSRVREVALRRLDLDWEIEGREWRVGETSNKDERASSNEDGKDVAVREALPHRLVSPVRRWRGEIRAQPQSLIAL